MLVTDENLALAGEILGAARQELLLADFENESRLMPVQAGRTHVDRMHMLRLLIDQGAISIQAGKMCPGLTQVPDWLFIASQLGYEKAQALADDFLPSDELKRKFDDELLKRIGLQGEKALVEMLSAAWPGAQVHHVSLFDDTLGYDIVFEISGRQPTYLEVKTSSRVVNDQFTFFISRNEESKSRTLAGWQLACVSIQQGIASFQGTLDLSRIRHEVPQNLSNTVEWQTLRIRTPLEMLETKEYLSGLSPVLVAPDRVG